MNENKNNYCSLINKIELGKIHPLQVKKVVLSNKYETINLSKEVEIKHSHNGPINALSIDTIENKYMLSVGIDANVLLYDLDQQERETSLNSNTVMQVIKPIEKVERQEKHKYSISSVCWYPVDNGMFTTASMDRTLKVWDTNNMKAIFTFKFEGAIYNHTFSPIAQTHSLIATGSSSTYIIMCDLRSGSQAHILSGHKNPVLALAWSPVNEYLLASGSGDYTIRLWDIRKPKACLASLCQYNSGGKLNDVTAHKGTVNELAFLPDGHHLLSAGRDNKIHLWRLGVNEYMNTNINFGEDLVNKSEKVLYPVVTNMYDCRPYLFQPSNDNSILMYDIFNGELKKRMKGHFESVNCIVQRSGRQELYSAGNDSEILMWNPTDPVEEVVEEEDNWSDDEEMQ